MPGPAERPVCRRQLSYHEAVPRDEVGNSDNAADNLDNAADIIDTAGVKARKANGHVAPRTGLLQATDDVLSLNHRQEVKEPVISEEKAPYIEAGDKGAKDDDDPDEIVDWNADEDDFQRPAKLDLVVGFIRLSTFVSACTSVFAIILSILFPIHQAETIFINVWRTYSFKDTDDIIHDQDSSDDSFEVLEPKESPNPNYPNRDFLFYLTCVCGTIQLCYLFINAVFVTVDSIGTVTFRWKEYGELTHRHTDATSIMFHVSKSRWKQRLLAALTVASATSLQTAFIIRDYYGKDPGAEAVATNDRLTEKSLHAVIWYLALMMVGLVASLFGFLLHFIPGRWRDVPWLDNRETLKHIDDKGDQWKSFQELAVHRRRKRQSELNSVGSEVPLKQDIKESPTSSPEPYVLGYEDFVGEKSPEPDDDDKEEHTYKELTRLGCFFEFQKQLIYFAAYILSITMNIYAVLLVSPDLHRKPFEIWTCILSCTSNSLISLYLVTLVCMQCFNCRQPHHATPFLSKVYVPFTLSCSLRILLDVNLDPKQQEFFGYLYILILALYILFHGIGFAIRRWTIQEPINNFVFKFFHFNFVKSEGSYKKWVRLFDTLGGFCGLVALILGIFSLLCDQYDLEFEVQGELKEILDKFGAFKKEVGDVWHEVKPLIDALNFKLTCEKIYSVVGGGGLAAFALSLIPGGSSAASIGTKSTYYMVKGMSAMKKLATNFHSNFRTMWTITRLTTKLAKFTVSAAHKFTIGSGSLTLLRLLPFIPPVVVGIHILFSSFWPQRILFFSASQRRRFIDGQKQHWFSTLLLLILALLINTVLINELQSAFNESLPFLDVHIQYRLGWKMAMAATAFAMASCVAFYTAYAILGTHTHKDHENLTNEEIEWKNFVESKKKTTYYNPFGAKIEWKNQIKYKKERIGGWTWVLPICLCLVACGLGVVANLYPKLDMTREAKGTFGRALDKLLFRVDSYETDKNKTMKEAGEECIPFATFNDLLRDNRDHGRSSLLVAKVYEYFSFTDDVVRPLKQIIQRSRKQFINDVGDKLFGAEVAEHLREHGKLDLQYLGMLLLIPKAIQLMTLVLGMLSMSYATCQMEIIPSLEPRKIVRFFGRMCMFSFVYNICTQIAIFNILTDFGIPFYRIYISYGLGFMYDVASEAVMWSVWIGMNNEFFFAIPRRKKTVTYSIPGVSDNGPNVQNAIY